MGKTGFLLSLMVVVLLPTFGATLSADTPNNITTDQLALLALKSHVTHDPRNFLATNWSTITSVCNWIGVTCGSKHHRVTALNFSGMVLTGTIQPHMGNLSFLAWLDIGDNNFHGPLPVELSNLRRLKYLNFGNNRFSGEIPSWFGSFTKLQSLFLNDNNFIGVIPSTLGNMSKLEMLVLYDNDFKGQIPTTVGNLSSLKHLYLENNQLSGEIPSVIGNLISLEFLDLSFNNLTGRIPTLPPRLIMFTLSENKLDGEIPSSICNLSYIEVLVLSMNNLGGIIPECLGNLSLLHLQLEMNNFHGKIPAILFSKNCLLRTFRIGSNQLEGPIPQSLINCKDLKVLDLGNNKLNDTFPSWLGNLKNLQVLVLRSNRFHGNIANYEGASSISHLKIIDLSDNNFNGYLLSKFFENLHAMVNGSKNKGQAEYLTYKFSKINRYHTEYLSIIFKGMERHFMGILTTLTIIDFSNNRFNGEIPEILGELSSLIVLNLSHNSLIGPIPSSLSNLSELESLDLSSNKLQGRIPAQLVNLDFLEVLNLSCNNLKGLIPRSNHFDTFTNDSCSGNLGLCGFPLSKACDQDLESPPTKFDDTRRELNWKFSILMGYGCGLVFGLSMGYIVFTTGKPWWCIQIIERVQPKYVGRKIRRSGGRK
ncbi:hypothetical protein CRYUN_Cryun38cG0012300 [Craigia yunnanensis]